MKKTTAALIALGFFGNAASAAVIDGIRIEPGAYLQVGTFYEGNAQDVSTPITAPGQIFTGIGIIDSILTNNIGQIWANHDNGAELTVHFGGYLSESVIMTPGSGLNQGFATIAFSGGWANFYSDTETSFDANNISSVTDGNLWLDTVGASTGYICSATDGCYSGVGTVITLVATIMGNDLSTIFSGSGSGFLDVGTGAGSANEQLDTNRGGSMGQDIAMGSSYDSLSNSGWFASGSINFKGQVIPEPATLSLLSISLIVFASVRRRRHID